MTAEAKASSNTDHCRNCGETLHGSFCAACGQKHIPDRLNTKDLLVSAFLAIFDLESKIWRTVRDLVRSPGRVALDYIGGKRFSYVNPLKYFLTVLAIYLGMLALTFGLDYLADQMVQVEGEDPAQVVEVGDALKSIIRNHMNLMIVLTVPIFAFLLRWQFWRSGRNYAETLSFVGFIAGQAYLYRIAIVLVEYALGSFSSGLGPAVSYIVLVQASKVFYDMSWPKTLAASFLAAMLFALASGVIGVILATLALLGLFG